MKKTVSIFVSLLIISMLSGCVSSNDKLGNLNLENTKYIENTPNTGKWQKITFAFPHLCEQSSDRIVNMAAAYGAGEIKKDDIMMQLLDNPEENVPLSDYDKYKTDVYEEFPFSHMFYRTDDIYIEVQGATGGMIELDNRKNVNSILGLDIKSNAPWRPQFFKTNVASVDLNDESATCILDGKTVKIADAIGNAEKYVLENDTMFPKSFGAKVTEAEIYSYKNGNQSLKMCFGYMIDGVLLENSPIYSIKDENGKKYNTYSVRVQIAKLTENTIDWIWFPVIDGGVELTREDCEIAISREDACKIVSQKLSREYEFNVEEIQLMYAAERVGDGTSCIQPVWRFHITEIKSQEYSKLNVYVSALNGEVQIAEVLE